MGLRDNLGRWLAGFVKAASKPAQIPAVIRAQADAYKYGISATDADKQADLYTKLTWISTAIDHVAQSCALNDFNVKEIDGEQLTDIDAHPFELLLRHPNPQQSRYDFLRDLVSWLKLTGNVYVWLNGSNENAEPDELWILPSNRVAPVPDGKLYLKGYVYDTGSGKIPLETWEIVHIKTFNPLNPYVGLSAIQSLALVANSDMAEQKWNYNLFSADNAKLPGLLAFADTIDDGEWDKLKAQAVSQWGGTKRSGPMMLRGVGAGGVQWVQMSATQKEMEFLQGRQFTKEEIWTKLAPGLLNILDKNVTEANATAGKAVFGEFCLWPLMVSVAEAFGNKILTRYGDNLVGEFDDVRKTDRLIEMQEQKEYSVSHTIKEIRMEYYGDGPLGDERDDLLPAEILKGGKATPQDVAAQMVPDQTPAQLETEAGQTATPPAQQAAVMSELRAWERWALKGNHNREFETRAIDLFTATQIRAGLKSAQTPAQVHAVFAPYEASLDPVEVLDRYVRLLERPR